MKFATLLALGSLYVSSSWAAPISSSEIQEKASQGLHLISLEEGVEPVWKTEAETLELLRAHTNFFDVTETYEIELANNAKAAKESALDATYAAPSHQTAVKAVIATLSTSTMSSYLSTLTSFNNRYYQSSTGLSAEKSLLSTLKSITSSNSAITVSEFTHSWTQPSIIVKWASTSSGAITILGAHMDSINLNSPSSGRAPGADDNGTGTVTLMETLRVLVGAGFKPSTPLEFHFYSGEEAGLLGSQAIAANYKSAAKSVKAYINFDMTGYFAPGSTEVVALETDYIDSGLNTFLRQCITAYLRIPAGTDYCGYACSDHASWYKNGFPSAMPFEAPTESENPYIHTTSDTTSVSGFSWSHALEFAKLAVAAAYELTV